MNTYFLLFILAMCSSLALTPIVRRVCERFNWLDDPLDDRRVHKKAIPRLGGVAVYITVLIALAALYLFDNLLTETIRASSPQLFAIFIPATILFLFGIYDDFRGTSAGYKFFAQGLVATIFYLLGGRIDALSVPLIGTVALPQIVGFALTIFWIIIISNAFNLIDGIDGLATGAALFASIVILIVSLILGHSLITVVAVVLCGSLIGFLRYNFNPASIFLGDSGSLFIGFTLAALSVLGVQKASTAVAVIIPIIAFGLPFLDTGFAIIRRFISRQPLFQGDREHIHHKLLDRGWSQRRVVLVLYGVCALFALLALFLVGEAGTRIIGLVLFVVGVAVLFIVNSLRYHEMDEIKAGVKRNFAERRLRVANNIRVRRASQQMSKAMTLSEVFSAMKDLLEFGEFVYATVQLGRDLDSEHDTHLNAREPQGASLREAEISERGIYWAWERGDMEAKKIVESGHFWTLRLPLYTVKARWGYLNLYRGFGGDALLLNINYLCDFFQSEMAQAVERILESKEQQKPETLELAMRASIRN